MKVICFGDSNTYGYDPRYWSGGRYGANGRWVDVLAAATGWTVCNLGENGRKIPTLAPDLPADVDLLILMLGTNNLLQGCSPQEVARELAAFLRQMPLPREQILLIAPPPFSLGQWVQKQRLIDDSHTFARCCRRLAQNLGIRFADAGEWNIPLAYDGVHFTEQGHRAFAKGLLEVLL